MNRPIKRRPEKDMMSEAGKKRGRKDERAEGSADCLIGAGLRRQLTVAEDLPTAVGKDIIQLHAKNDRELERRAEPIVCQVAEVPQAAGEKHIRQEAQRHALDVSLGLIRQ